MDKQSPSDVILSDPLREITRKERTHLLIASLFGILLGKTTLLPSKIDTLGIEFAQTDRNTLLFILFFLTAYFLLAFLLYAAVDFTAWRLSYLNAFDFPESNASLPSQDQIEGRKLTEDELKELKWYMDLHRSHRLFFYIRGPLSAIRALFDFILPVALSLYAMTSLWLART